MSCVLSLNMFYYVLEVLLLGIRRCLVVRDWKLFTTSTLEGRRGFLHSRDEVVECSTGEGSPI